MDERGMIRRWVHTLEQVGPELEAIRLKEIRDADNLHVLNLLESAFDYAARALPPRPTSGIIEMQSVFAKLRK